MSAVIISSKDLFMYIYNEDNIIVDIREEEEYLKGHILGAINVCYDDNENVFMNKIEKIINRFKISSVVIYCSHGGTSYRVADLFSDMDNIRILLLYGGIDAYKGELSRG